MMWLYPVCLLNLHLLAPNTRKRSSKNKSIIFPIYRFSILYFALSKFDSVTLYGVRRVRSSISESFVIDYLSIVWAHIIDGWAAEYEKSVYVSDTATANQTQFWYRRFRYGNFNGKSTTWSGRAIGKDIDKKWQSPSQTNKRQN